MVRLVADAGGTKTDWCLLSSKSTDAEFFTTGGINPSIMSDEQLSSVVNEVCNQLRYKRIFETQEGVLSFFGAGCNFTITKERLNKAFDMLKEMGVNKMSFDSDLAGASKALFGDSEGITCIIGTGSSSCIYDGHTVTDSVPPLGYILGDEGSGAFMGKTLLNAYFKRELSNEVCRSLIEFADIEPSEVISKVYRTEGANKYLASFVPFLKKHETLEEISNLIDQSLKLFFKKNVFKYKDYQKRKIGFAGGIANAFSSRIERLATEYGLQIAGITNRPIEGLYRYFLKNIDNNEI